MKLNKWISLIFLGALSACSSSSNGGDDDPDGGDGPGGSGDDEIIEPEQDGPPCEPKSCEELARDCGPVADGCGRIVECGECEGGEICGIEAANVCTDPADLATPLDSDEACAGRECGPAGDGVGGVVECGDCADGEMCGASGPAQCGELGASNSEECPARIDGCAELGANCGLIGNGCGGVIDCDEEMGGCTGGEVCGVEELFQCGTPGQCEPRDEEQACEGKCGLVSNGCSAEVDGGLIDCGALPGHECDQDEVCGGGGVPNECGSGSCEPAAAADACGDRECGMTSNGCDGSVACGTCSADEVCLDGFCDPRCEPIPRVQACAGKDCGRVGDGCGGSHDCGSCATGESCGLFAPFMCDPSDEPTCVAFTAQEACAGRECGIVLDGCGAQAENEIDCGALNGGCDADEVCGVATPFQCDEPVLPDCNDASSCAELGWECGIAIDECGSQFDCTDEGRVCDPLTETCIGGINGPARCLSGTQDEGPCDVCDAIPNCTGEPQKTVLTGRVITPGISDSDSANQLGVPNAFVYILRNDDESELPPIESGIPSDGTSYLTTCDRCDDQDLGPVLTSTSTNALGEFRLEVDIPIQREFVLVVKIGKWRRARRITLPLASACTETNLPPAQSRLPRNMSDGLGVNIPKVAVSTGVVDAMECVLYKLGIAGSEFDQPGVTGDALARIHLYRSENAGGAQTQTGSTGAAALYGDTDRLFSYDMLIFDCEGTPFEHNADDPRIREYVNRGGRMFASHLTYTWIHDNTGPAYASATFANTGLGPAATWTTTPNTAPDVGTGIVSIVGPRPQASPRIQTFADWMVSEGVTTAPGYTFSIVEPRSQATGLGASTEEFVFCDGQDCSGSAERTQQFSFNTPYSAPEEAICGRVAYSGFHVAPGASGYADSVFPNHCAGALTAQEKVLAFMLFDLGACVSPDGLPPPPCNPVTNCGGRCGNIPDGCGGVVTCQGCPEGEICLPGGVCAPPDCQLTTCDAEGAECGQVSDGCNGVLECGECPEGEVCGLLRPGQCSPPCTQLDQTGACDGKCGFVSDECSDVYDCGECPPGLSCVDNECVDRDCDPQTSCPAPLDCGITSDGCDGTLDCGDCEAPEVCGGAGESNVCGVPECPPLDCEAQGAECGMIGDGCYQSVDCGECIEGQICGLDAANQCSGCDPQSCSDVGAECGMIGTGCGRVTVDCGECPAGETCGGQEPNRCDAGECPGRSCEQAGAECGLIGDGCGGVVDCGDCSGDQVCGIDTPFICGDPPECEPTTCAEQDAECGLIGDDCEDLLDCGDCPPGSFCSATNQCSGISR